MSVKKNEWHYLDEDTNQWNGPVTLAELDGLRQQGRIHEFTQVVNTQMAQRQGPMSSGVPYSRISRLAVEFDPSPENFLASRDGQIATVLSGPNNCGKTLLLRQLFALLDHDAYLIQCNRFSHVDVLNTRQQEEHEHRRYYDNFLQNFHTSQQNTEDNELRLEQVITGLKDSQLDKLFQLSSKLLGNEFSLKRSDPESRFSPYYVDMDGENLRYGSSGTRLLITLLGILFDERFSVILIDEPEIGLSPKIQAALARFLYDKEQRKDFCPHLRQVFVATHSHLFLDRNVISNNFTVMKEKTIVTVQQVQSLSALHQLQFNLLGNELESVFLPSAILIVEGTSDETFLARIMQLHIPDRRITIVRAGGDGEISKKLNVLKEALGDLFTSPYHDRLFLVFDSKHSASIIKLQNQGIRDCNINIWSKNGIEYLYPEDILAETFHCDVLDVKKINLEADPIQYNGIRKSKKELARTVVDILSANHAVHAELDALLLRVRSVCN